MRLLRDHGKNAGSASRMGGLLSRRTAPTTRKVLGCSEYASGTGTYLGCLRRCWLDDCGFSGPSRLALVSMKVKAISADSRIRTRA